MTLAPFPYTRDQPQQFFRRNGQSQQVSTGNSMASWGLANPLVTATGGSTAAGADTEGSWQLWTTGTTSGQNVNLQTGVLARIDWNSRCCARTKSSETANVRFWCGWASASPHASADPSATHVAAWTYDTATDGSAYWRAYTANGSASTRAATTLAIDSSAHRLRVDLNSAGYVQFWADDILYHTATATLPASGTSLIGCVSITTLTNAAKAMRYEWWGFDSN